MPKQYKPIKRHESLYPLSHHHHHALVMALMLKRAGTEKSKHSLSEIKEEVKKFWSPNGRDHFRDEEEILLTAYAQYASVDKPEINEMLIQHVNIRALIDLLLRSNADLTKIMNELGMLLEAHIRKEERVIFPMIEEALPDEKLKELEQYLHAND